MQAGSFDTARSLLAIVRDRPADALQHARIDLIRAQLAFVSSRGNDATPLLLSAARRLEQLDTELARETYLDAFSAALFGAGSTRMSACPRWQTPLERHRGRPRARPRLPTCCWMPWWPSATTTTRPWRPCRRALRKLSSEKVSPEERLRWLWQGSVVALEVWDDESAYVLSHESVQIARETGTLSELALALSARVPVLVFCGELSAAAAGTAEAQSVQEATGIVAAPYGALILAAWRGQVREAQRLIEMTMREAGSRGEGIGLAICEYARAVLCNGVGQYDEALLAACSASEYHEVVVENWGLSELIEPATRTGRTDLASEAMNRLAGKARASGTDWALGIEARSRALLSAGAVAEPLFREGIERLEPDPRARRARPHPSAVRGVASP